MSTDLLLSSRPSGRHLALDEDDGSSFTPERNEVDSSYADPLGPMPERPKTANKRANNDEFADEDIGDDLLPE